MKKSEDKFKILYLGREKCVYSILIAILFYCFMFTIFNKVPNVRGIIISIIYIVGSCTIVLLSQSVFNIYKKTYYLVICYLYTFSVMYSMYLIIPDELIKYRWMCVLKNEIFLRTLYVETIVLFIHKINADIFRSYKKIRVSKVFLISSFSFVINFIYLLSGRNDLLIITNLVTFIMVMMNIKLLKKVKFSLNDKVNGVLILLFIFLIILVTNILSATFFKSYGVIDEFIRMIIFLAFIFLIVLIIDKFINRPYSLLFSDIYKENIEMDLLNSKVVKKNRELEFSQAVIRKKEKMFKTFFISTPIPLALIANNGRIIFANSSFQKLIEEDSIKSVINKKIFNIIHINNFIDVNELIHRGTKEISGTIDDNETQKYVDVELMDISENNNEVLVIINDVTSRVNVGKLKTEMENNKFQERIKSDFLSNISHDLKTPINVIYSAAQLVSMFIKNSNKEALEKYNMICKSNCFSLIRLTNNLIDSSRIYSNYLSPNLQLKNIVEIIEEIVMSLVDYAKSKNINLVFDTDEEEIYVKTDEEFMQRIVINLISNAIKFTSEGGKIEVIIHNEEKYVYISVKDTGAGMEKEFIDKAFNRYAMGKNNEDSNEKSKRGTGIGLFVVKKLVEKQNGEINIESEIAKGTNVQMKFCKEI